MLAVDEVLLLVYFIANSDAVIKKNSCKLFSLLSVALFFRRLLSLILLLLFFVLLQWVVSLLWSSSWTSSAMAKCFVTEHLFEDPDNDDDGDEMEDEGDVADLDAEKVEVRLLEMNCCWCVFRWARKLQANANLFSQIVQTCGLSPIILGKYRNFNQKV